MGKPKAAVEVVEQTDETDKKSETQIEETVVEKTVEVTTELKPAVAVRADEARFALAPFLLERPLALSRRSVDTLKAALLQGAASDASLRALFGFGGDLEASKPYELDESGTATVPVRGVLVNHADSFWACLCGLTSYEGLGAAISAAVADPNVKSIALDIDSPGGEIDGCFDLVDAIYAARGKKPIVALVNEQAFSAAYAIASAADKIFVPRTGGVGSIGVIFEHVDYSKMEEQLGIKVTAYFAGERKNDFSEHEPASPEAEAWLTKVINEQYEIFVSAVARNRGISAEKVRGTQAGLFFGGDAVAAGLADAVSSITEARAALGGTQAAVSPLRALEADLAAARAETESVKTSLATAVAEARASVHAWLDDAIARCRAGGRLDLVVSLLETNAPAEKLGATLADLMASGQSPEIRNVIGDGAGHRSALVSWIVNGANQRR